MPMELWLITWLAGLSMGVSITGTVAFLVIRRERVKSDSHRNEAGNWRTLHGYAVATISEQSREIRQLSGRLKRARRERQDLDQRIRRQRHQLRLNWEILEVRNKDHHRPEVRSRLLAVCQRLRAAADPEGTIARLRRDQAAMLIQVGDHARARGEAEGALMMSERAGVLEEWRTRALAAEARASELERGKAAAMGLQQGGSLIIRDLEKQIAELRDTLLPFGRYALWARRAEWPADIAEDPATPVLGRSSYEDPVGVEVTVGDFNRALDAVRRRLEEE